MVTVDSSDRLLPNKPQEPTSAAAALAAERQRRWAAHRMKLTILNLVGLLGACALPNASSSESAPRPRLPVVVSVDGLPQQRDVRFKEVRAGQVLVAGCWTVYFSVGDSDMIWIRDLAAHHDSVALEWDGRKVCSFDEKSHGDGYFIDRGFNDEATARRVADEIKARQSIGGK